MLVADMLYVFAFILYMLLGWLTILVLRDRGEIFASETETAILALIFWPIVVFLYLVWGLVRAAGFGNRK